MVEMALMARPCRPTSPPPPTRSRRASSTARSIPSPGRSTTRRAKQVVAEGETISDGDLLKMDWYVEGVQGTIPK